MNWFDSASLEELEDAYESLADRRSVFGRALADLIAERRAAESSGGSNSGISLNLDSEDGDD